MYAKTDVGKRTIKAVGGRIDISGPAGVTADRRIGVVCGDRHWPDGHKGSHSRQVGRRRASVAGVERRRLWEGGRGSGGVYQHSTLGP